MVNWWNLKMVFVQLHLNLEEDNVGVVLMGESGEYKGRFKSSPYRTDRFY